MSERPWPENVQPTAEQFVGWFIDEERDEQIRIARQLLKSTERSSRCFAMNHDGLAEEVQHLRRAAARYRIAWMSAARRRIHPQRILREFRKYATAEDDAR